MSATRCEPQRWHFAMPVSWESGKSSRPEKWFRYRARSGDSIRARICRRDPLRYACQRIVILQLQGRPNVSIMDRSPDRPTRPRA